MNTAKNYGGDLCKNHSARSEKEFCRVCPSNLNKKELENVYFTLLENNLDLKTTTNSQREKIKILSTKVQRLTALQKTYLGKQPKECSGSIAIVNEQKECISELQRSNQSLSERVRQLNMRLCSAKQFLKRSPFQSTSRCSRCGNKNNSMSALITKRSETNLRTTAASSQYLVKDIMSSRTADNVIISHEKSVQYEFCEENKCRTHIEELKKENDDLQNELSRVKDSYATASSRLERDLNELRVENVRVRSERTLAEDSLEQLRTQLGEVTVRLGGANLRCDELSVELAVERRRAGELEARLRAADMSGRIADVIETHLTNIQTARHQTNVFRDVQPSTFEKPATDDSMKLLTVQSPQYKPRAAVRTKIPPSVQLDDVFRNADDSGYTEVNRSQEVDDTKASTYINQLLLEKIADLQNQVNNLKSVKNNYNTPNESFTSPQRIDSENNLKQSTLREQQQPDVNIIYASSDSLVTEKKGNTNMSAIQQAKSGNTNDTESKTQTINDTNNLTEVHPHCEGGDIVKQHSDFNVETELRESFIRFERPSNAASRGPHALVNHRQLSLHSSRNLDKEKSLIKTSSLDENRLDHAHNMKKDSMQKFEAKLTNKEQTSKSNVDIVANMEEFNVPDKRTTYTLKEKLKESDKATHIQNKLIVKKEEKNITEDPKDEKEGSSDSSRRTYSVHKDDNKFKLTTKSKDAYPNTSEEIKKINHSTVSAKNLVVADVTKVLNGAMLKNKAMRRRKCTASEPRTHAKERRDLSPDSTEGEISSLSDLPSERDERSGGSRSPGEQRPAHSGSRSATSTTSSTSSARCSLSEGELPAPTHSTFLSDGEKRVSNYLGKSHSVPVSSAQCTQRMEATLAAVERELARCTLLLRSPARPPPRAPRSSQSLDTSPAPAVI